jgi:hypothetical protein
MVRGYTLRVVFATNVSECRLLAARPTMFSEESLARSCFGFLFLAARKDMRLGVWS